MRYAILDNNNTVKNIAVSDSAIESNWIPATDTVTVGDLYSDGTFSKPESPIEDQKEYLIKELKKIYNTLLEDPVCTTSLGFRVNSGYNNLVDFREGLARNFLTIRDYDNQYHTVTTQEMEGIIQDIVDYGFAMKQNKWQKEDEINNSTLETISNVDVKSGWPS